LQQFNTDYLAAIEPIRQQDKGKSKATRGVAEARARAREIIASLQAQTILGPDVDVPLLRG
jgi:hypothetical protein